LTSKSPLPTLPTSLLLLLLPYTINQHSSINFELLAQQQQEQLAALQERMGGEAAAATSTEVARPQVLWQPLVTKTNSVTSE